VKNAEISNNLFKIYTFLTRPFYRQIVSYEGEIQRWPWRNHDHSINNLLLNQKKAEGLSWLL